jgi:predicted molibdopterin-dependent oxidoreductase YjgC
MVSTFQDKPIAETICNQCAECVKVCPVGSLVFKKKTPSEIPEHHHRLV